MKRQLRKQRLGAAAGLFLACCASASMACAPGEPGCSADSSGWMAYMQEHLPRQLCAGHSPFVECTSTPSQCSELATGAVQACLAEHARSIPSMLNRAEAGDWGETVADCAGKRIFLGFTPRGALSAACNKWLQPPTSTDRAAARDRTEQMVAHSPRLTRLDAELKQLALDLEANHMLIGIDHPAPDPRGDALRAWQQAIAQQCDSQACLEKAYRKRIRELKAALK